MKRSEHLPSLLALALLFVVSVLSNSWRARSESPDQLNTKPELVMQTGHSLSVNCAVFGPDHRWLAAGGADNLITLWDVDSGLELRALTGHQNWINALAVSADGELLASASNDRTIKVWNVASGREILTLKGHTAAVEAVLFSPDRRWIASGSADHTIKLWDSKSGRTLQTLTADTPVTKLAVSPDGKTLASGSADGTLKLWNTVDWNLSHTLTKQTKTITALAFNPDNREVVSGTESGELAVWDAISGKARFTTRQPGAAILMAAFNTERELVSVTTDGMIVFRDSATGKQKAALPGNSDSPATTFASVSKDGKFLASGTGNRSFEIRNLADRKPARSLATHTAAFFAVAFSRDGSWLAAGANDHSVRLWQVATGREMPRLSGHTGWVLGLAFSPDSRQLATASINGEVKIWDVSSGREVQSQSYGGDQLHAIMFSDDAKWLAAAGTGQVIHLLDLSNEQTRNLPRNESEITSLVFLPGSSLIASAGTDKTIRIWDAARGTLVKALQPLGEQINALAVSPRGDMLAAGTDGGTVELIKLDNAERQTLPGHSHEIFNVAFSRDGSVLAAGGQDQNIRLWDPATGREVQTLTGASGAVNGLAFSNNSHFLVSANEDAGMTVWNAETGTAAATVVSMPGHDDWLVATPDGLFDGSPAAWKFLLWRFAQSTFKVAPVESFFNEFYYPGLLADVLANKNPKAKQDIAKKDRRQPSISIQNPVSTVAGTQRTVQLKLDVTEAPPDGEYHEGSGARDLRLFRNGLLVQAWADDVLQGASQRTIETNVPIVAGENEFTAYAFNRDNVKSADSGLSINGAETLHRQGTAYLFVIGVSKYANSQYNLNYSVADATGIASQLKAEQEALNHYHPVEVISLLNEQATKENILLALKLLTGTAKASLPKDKPADLLKIKPAQPEDAVVFYFSGHGTADGDRFFLIPHDLGYQGPKSSLDQTGLRTILDHSVSDLELEAALRPLDVDQLLLIIDACNSGQALESSDQRRGPMNTRGFAQLAYEKGMYVLTASQSSEAAFESIGLQHSYLAYALLEEGIKSGAADADHDGQITLNEWLSYATNRVPKIRPPKQEGGKQLEEVEADEKRVQRPRVFNMREGGAERFVIARASASAQSR
jgi:WD40 repeat protein/uncharacterized caspase-like protein